MSHIRFNLWYYHRISWFYIVSTFTFKSKFLGDSEDLFALGGGVGAGVESTSKCKISEEVWRTRPLVKKSWVFLLDCGGFCIGSCLNSPAQPFGNQYLWGSIAERVCWHFRRHLSVRNRKVLQNTPLPRCAVPAVATANRANWLAPSR